MKIGEFDTDKKVLIIAEIGNNHEGDFNIACEMIEAAAEAGADAVKFQTFKTEHYVSKENLERYSRLKSFELSFNDFEKLSVKAKELGLLFLSTPFDLFSADALSNFVDGMKISSGDNNFYPLIEKVSEFNLPTILSLGLLGIDDIKTSLTAFTTSWDIDLIKEKLAILHCVCSYPVPDNEANLGALLELKRKFDCTIGYSDHVMGNTAALLSVALGARIVEKHFTLDNNFSDFRDHQMSADFEQMKTLTKDIRSAEALIGNHSKQTEKCEIPQSNAVRRSIVLAKNMQKGDCVTLQDITWVRPGGGIPPGNENLIIGKILKKDLSAGIQIKQEHLKSTP